MPMTDEILARFKEFKTFTFNDVGLFLAKKYPKTSDSTIRVTLSRMVKEGRLYKVIKGVFSLKEGGELAGFAFSPFYYGGLSALMIRDLIDDQVKMEIMTTKSVRRSRISLYNKDLEAILHHMPRKYYFGFDDFPYAGITVPVSDPEKTLIDLFYYRRRLSKTDYSGLLKSINMRKLRKYLKAYDGHTRAAVLNFARKYRQVAISGKLDNQY